MPPDPRRVQIRSNRTDIYDRAFRGDDEGRKGLGNAKGAPDIDLVHALCDLEIDVQYRHRECLPGVVDQNFELPARLGFYCLEGSLNAGRGGGIKGEEGDVGDVAQVGHLGWVAGGREDIHVALMERGY